MKASFAICIPVCLGLVFLTSCRSSAERSRQAVLEADRAFADRDYAAARKQYAKASKLERLNGRAYLGLAKTNLQLGNADAAEPALVRAMDTLDDWPSLRECYVDLAGLYLTRHATDRAYVESAGKMASELLTRDPHSFDGHRLRAAAWSLRANLTLSQSEASGWRRGALEEFAASDAIKPNDPDVLLAWADAKRANDDLEGAKALYQRAQALEPANASILEGLYAIALKQQNFSAASGYVSAAAVLDTKDDQPLFGIARQAIAAGRSGDAHIILEALANRGSHPDQVAEFLAQAGYIDAAVLVWQKAASQYPAWKSYFLGEAAERPALLGKDDTAAMAAADCLKKLPKDKTCRAVRAYEAYQTAGRSKDLVEMERFVFDDPSSVPFRWYLGRMYQQSGRLNDARRQFNLGLVAHQDEPHLRLALAQLELEANAPEAARADAQRLLGNDPQNPVAREIISRTDPDRHLR